MPDVPRAAPSPTREVHCADALAWLAERPALTGCSVITSLPDVSELDLSLSDWKRWFVDAAARVMRSVPADGAAIFYQTDIKKAGTWVDKGQLVHRAADDAGCALLWHKIVCRKPAGTVTFGRPAYAHLCCFSRALTVDPARASADVIADPGVSTWTRGMGTAACALACRFVLTQTPTRTVVDPFCGQGMVLAVANAMGLHAVGVELSAKRARKARALQISL